MVHKRRAKKFYNKLKAEATSSTEPHIISLCMDFMPSLCIPQVPVQETFYLLQVTVNLFSIHDIKKKSAKVYVYHERIAHKSPYEVCSFLYDYLKDVPQEITELRLFSENCSGQNNNHALSRLLLSLTDTIDTLVVLTRYQ